MQFPRNQLPDLKNNYSCLILTLLRIEQCTIPDCLCIIYENIVQCEHDRTNHGLT